MTDEFSSKDEITTDVVAALAAHAGIAIGSDRVEVIADRLRELFDLAAPIEGAAVEELEVTHPFDPRWPEEVEGATS